MTRRSVMTKCVVHQVRNGHTVSQPTTTSQMARITGETTVLALDAQPRVWIQAAANEASAVASSRIRIGPEQALPVRVAVQHHLLVAGQDVVGISHPRSAWPGQLGKAPGG